MKAAARLTLGTILLLALSRGQPSIPEFGFEPVRPGEFHFIRLEYRDLAGAGRRFGRGWWRQDWPDAEVHFAQGIRRLTAIDVGDGRHFSLTDERLLDYPWAYATQVGYWDLSDEEVAGLREYLLRGGFLMTDDFYGAPQYAVFRESMKRVFPDRPIVEIDPSDEILHSLYDLDQRIQIPGLRHLRRGFGGEIEVLPQDTGPRWEGIYDDDGRLLVAVNYNMDIGDAWEHADWPEYPEPMTALAYRFGINYIVYAMTH
ncbi:MAG: DUF4159 domain-containing protein [Acidobacteria bacterium]|nr:DUF4159 domain-containing protein [Acidobacteriota bacterium]